jgi:hypothetical protein
VKRETFSAWVIALLSFIRHSKYYHHSKSFPCFLHQPLNLLRQAYDVMPANRWVAAYHSNSKKKDPILCLYIYMGLILIDNLQGAVVKFFGFSDYKINKTWLSIH